MGERGAGRWGGVRGGRMVRAGRAAGSHRVRGEEREWGEPGAEARRLSAYCLGEAVIHCLLCLATNRGIQNLANVLIGVLLLSRSCHQLHSGTHFTVAILYLRLVSLARVSSL